MLTFDELVAQLRAAEGAGFDVSADQAGKVLNRWIKRLAALSMWVKEERELGPSVADQDVYSLSDDIVDIATLHIGDSTALRGSADELFALKSGASFLQDVDYAYAPRYTSSGVKEFVVYPTPTTAGTSMTGLVAVIPAALSGSQTPPFPDDLEEALLHGAKATLSRDLDNDPDMADYYEGKFLADAELLRRRGKSRVGGGAWQIPVGRY